MLYDHFFTKVYARIGPIPFTGTTGVCLFFIISGFLITDLLLQERAREGEISLKNFYLRRCLRIFPPYYFYLGVVGLLAFLGFLEMNWSGYKASFVYCYNLYSGHFPIVDHSWSLSIEEQFYLIWPLLCSLSTPARAIKLIFAGLLAWPLLRFLHHGYLISPNPYVALETAAMDTILFGALLAYFWRDERFIRVTRPLARTSLSLMVAVVVLWGLYSGRDAFPTWFVFFFPWIRNSLLTFVVWWCTQNPTHLVGRFLRWPPVAHIGLLSYSLYLWQQPFSWASQGTSHGVWSVARFPLNLVAAYISASPDEQTALNAQNCKG